MSDTQDLPEVENVTEEAPETQEPTSLPDLPEVETAFVVMKNRDGSWGVTSDVTQPFAIDRVASRADVRIGTTEIGHLLSHQDLAALVAATIKASNQENS
jgi:hypothetical protein